MDDIFFRCRHFRNDRPCIFHKEAGTRCPECSNYEPVDTRILVIKLDALGDVLRTTCLLPSLKHAYPHSHITWVTRPAAAPLLEQNPMIDRLVADPLDVLPILQSERFDLAINPDANPTAARLLQLATAGDKRGMGWSPHGHVTCCNPAAETWLRLGLLDPEKRANRRTYQEHLHQLCSLAMLDPRPQLFLSAQERQWAASHLQRLGIDQKQPVVGLNAWAGERWPQKSWKESHLFAFIEITAERHPYWQLLLLGGAAEEQRNFAVAKRFPRKVKVAGSHPLRHFAALVGKLDLLVCADSLSLHVGLATRRPLVVLLGPTSHAEIDLCGQGEKLIAPLNCLSCYRTSCDRRPDCMDLISPEMVLAACERLLAQHEGCKESAGGLLG